MTGAKRVTEIGKSEEGYRHLLENVNDAAFVADVKTGLIVDTNQQATILLGKSRDEIVGRHYLELHPADKVQQYRQSFAAHVEKGRAADYDGEVVRGDVVTAYHGPSMFYRAGGDQSGPWQFARPRPRHPWGGRACRGCAHG